MNAMLQKFCSRLVSLGLNVFAQDKAPAKDGWITVHPNGKEHKGQHVEIDDETGGVKKGFGGKFKGQKISEIKSGFRGPQVNRLTERPDRKPEPAPMRTPAPQTSAGQNLGGRLQDVLQKRQQEMEKSQSAPSAVQRLTKADVVSQFKSMTDAQKEDREKELEKQLNEYVYGGKQLSDSELHNIALEREVLIHGTYYASMSGQNGQVFDKWVQGSYERLKGAKERAATSNPAEIAGARRGTPMEPKAADGDSVNPDYNLSDSYKINCQSCTFAYELRRRDYNVEARPRGDEASGGSGQWGDRLSLSSNDAYINVLTGEPPVRIPVRGKNTRSKAGCMRMLNDIDGIIQPGERYAFRCTWVGKRYGHIFNMEKDKNGELYLIDSQSGVFLKGKDEAYSKYFSQVSGMKQTMIFRLDNTKINPEYSHVLKEARA